MNEDYKQEQALRTEEGEPLGALQRVIKIFVSPGEVFRSINIKPNFLLPIIIVIVLTLGFYLAFFSQFKELILQTMEAQMQNAPNPMPEEMIQKTANITAIGTIIASPFMIVVGILLSALYYWVFGLIFKTKSGYLKYLSLMANVYLITMLSVVLTSLMLLMTGEFQLDEPITSLASLLPEGMKMTPIYGMALKFEVFSIWRMVLVYLGIKEIGGLSTKKALTIVITAFVLGLLFSGGSIWLSSLGNQLG